MTRPLAPRILDLQSLDLPKVAGKIALILPADGVLDAVARRVDRLTKGAIGRAIAAQAWGKLGAGDGMSVGFPAGLAAEAVILIKLDRRAPADIARRAGAKLAKLAGHGALALIAGNHPRAGEIAQGVVLRHYDFTDHKSDPAKPETQLTIYAAKPDDLAAQMRDPLAVADGVFFTRDLINEPANILGTEEFARRLAALADLGVKVEILEEADLEKLGMRALLGVGQGSETPSKVVVMEWAGKGRKEAPLALVGKGVVFDTGGISIKPAAGMEEMTMDMGGAGVVAGVMKALALRKSPAHVVGLVGLVENMPDGRAQRPGDVVRSMKGDTIEVINTDAEGRLVLADVLWYAQDRFKPRAMVDLATLTGAIIVGLGHENAGVFANDDAFCAQFLKSAKAADEGAWRMPLDPAYDELIKSRIADIKNTGGRWAGSITAAKFLQRFVKPDTPWIHLDIAGVASTPKDSAYAPAGASGWGVRSLDRMIADHFED